MKWLFICEEATEINLKGVLKVLSKFEHTKVKFILKTGIDDRISYIFKECNTFQYCKSMFTRIFESMVKQINPSLERCGPPDILNTSTVLLNDNFILPGGSIFDKLDIFQYLIQSLYSLAAKIFHHDLKNFRG